MTYFLIDVACCGEEFIKVFDHKNIEWGNSNISLKQFEYLFSKEILSSNPNISIERRWGSSPSAISHNIISKMKSNIKKRNLVIEKGNEICLDHDCIWGDNHFKEANTLVFDKIFNSMFMVNTQYCDIFSFPSCNSIVNEILIKTNLDFFSEKMSVLDSLKRIPFLSHHPKDTLANRWGDNWAYHNSYVFEEEVKKLVVLENSIAIVNETKIVNLKTKKTLYEAVGENKFIVSKDERFIIEKLNDGFRLLESVGLSEISLVKMSDIVNISWIKPNVFAIERYVKGQNLTVSLYKINSRLIEKIYEKSGVSFFVKAHNGMISYTASNNDQVLINLYKGKVNEVNVGKLDLSNCHGYQELEKFSVCYTSGFDGTSNSSTVVVNAISRFEDKYIQVSKKDQNCYISSTLDKKNHLLISCSEQNNANLGQLIEISDDLKVESRQNFKGMVQAYEIVKDQFIIASYEIDKKYSLFSNGVLETKLYSTLAESFGIPHKIVGMTSGIHKNNIVLGLFSTKEDYLSYSYFLYNFVSKDYQSLNFKNRFYMTSHATADNNYLSLSLFGEEESSENWLGNIEDNNSLIPLWSHSVEDGAVVMGGTSSNIVIKTGHIFIHLGHTIWLDDLKK